MKKEPIKRYSEAFKQQVVREYENGTSLSKLRQKYGIGGYKTIKAWVKKYSRTGIRTEKVIIQTVEDQLEYQRMKARISELEQALADAVIDNRMLTTTIEVASERLEMDIKKNFGKKSS